MTEEKEPLSSKKITILEKENAELRKIIKLFSADGQEISSIRLFLEARKKFLSWIAIIIAIITLFGLVSLTNIVKTIRDKIEARGIESIITEIKDDFETKHQPAIIDEAISRLMPTIEGKIEEAIRNELLQKLRDAEKKVSGYDKLSLVHAIENSYKEERYMVVTGSSPAPIDLDLELKRLKDKIGSQFPKSFPNIEIYSPSKGYTNYALVLDTGLTYSEAKSLQIKAIVMGFRNDTYIKRITKEDMSIQLDD